MPVPRRRWVIPVAVGTIVLAPALGWGAYATVTWLAFGQVPSSAGADSRLERYMPRHDIAEVHHTRVAAPAAIAYEAARAMDLHRSGVVHAIFRSREILLRATPPERAEGLPLVTELLSIGWGVLEEEPGRQIVLGAITQPWRADVVFRTLPGPTFASFDSAGYVKIVVTIAAESTGPQASVLRTETRALATDGTSRARFRRYWAIFSPGILLIRWRALSLARREAEAAVTEP